MYLTAVFKLRADDHDRRLLRTALARWSHALGEALDRARNRQGELLGCLQPRPGREGQPSVLATDTKALHALVLECVRGTATHLHSSATMSLVVALEKLLGSWLGLYLDWLQSERKGSKPGFPTLPPPTDRQAEARYHLALDSFIATTDSTSEARWRAEVQRAARGRLLPQYFGAAQSGSPSGMAHCGLLRREDGRYYALLTLWPANEALGAPVTRARNRTDSGEVRNIRAEAPFTPTARARSSVMIPLEMGRGHEHLFLRRATPKSAELVHQSGEYFLHVAFEFSEHPPRENIDHILALRRGIRTLLAYVITDSSGQVVATDRIEGRELIHLVTAIRKLRAQRQQKGQTLVGDRRLARTKGHHLYSAGHQVIDVACRYSAQIVLLADSGARKPQRLLAYRHFHRLGEILRQLAAEAGLPPPREERLYGSWATCICCGWTPGQPVRHEDACEGECPGCRARRDEDYHVAHLLALDTLRRRVPAGERPALADFIRGGPQTLTTQ